MTERRSPLVRPVTTTTAIATVTVVGGTLVINGAPVSAANFEVTNLNANGAGTFAQAVIDANANAGPDTITFAAGLTGTITLAATANITDDVTITGPGSAVITITNAGGDILYVYNTGPVEVSGITLDSAGDNAIDVYDAGDLTVSDVVITNSTNDGITVEESAAVTITSSTISGSGGDGVDVEYSGAVSITDTTIADNEGRGLAVDYSGDVSLDGSTVDGNEGDGIDVSGSGDVTVTDSAIESNDGTGARLQNVQEVAVTDSMLTGNDQRGLYAQDLDTFSLVGSEVAANDYLGMRINTVAGLMTLQDSVIFANDGTGMYTNDLDDVDVDNVVVSENRFTGLILRNPDEVTIDGLVAENNRSAGLRIYDANTVTASDITITDSGREGLVMYSANGAVSFEDTVVSSSGRDGMRLSNMNGSVSITDSTFDGNLGDGLDLYNVDGAVSVEGSTVSRNRESGLELRRLTTGATFTNSTISENNAIGTDSVVNQYDADVVFEHSTISGNVDSIEAPPAPAAPLVGGSKVIELYQSDVTLDHTIVAGNDDMDSVYIGPGSAVTSADYSVVSPGSGFGGTSIEAADPGLTVLRDNGGPTETMQPARGSLVLEAGDPAIATPPATDQRGEARVVGVIDIGAVEGAEASAIDSIAPARFVDTRPGQSTIDGQFEGEGKRAAGSEYTVQIAGRGQVPADAVGVVANVTAIAADGTGFVTVHPCVTPRPNASSLNYTAGVNLGNEIIAGLNASGEACFYTSQSAHLTVDVVGFISADSPTMPVTPARLMDTRAGQQTVDGLNAGLGIRPAGSTTNLRVLDRGGVPADAEAVIVNVTAVGPTTNGFVTVHPCLPTLPTAASLNFTAGVNRGNELVASVSDAGEICLYTSAEVHLTVDVVGYVPAGTNLAAVDPARLVDTRPGQTTIDGQNEGGGPRPAGSELTVAVAGRAGVPANATSAIINVTAVGASGVGFVTVHPCVTPRPTASSLNYVAGVNGGNEIIAQLDGTGSVCVYTSAETNLTIDIVGFLT